MRTFKYPIYNTSIRLNLASFEIEVIQNEEPQLFFKEGDPPFNVAVEGSDYVITTDSSPQQFPIDMIYDTIRSFEIMVDLLPDCTNAGGLGVVDIRDLRCSHKWCLQSCSITLELTFKDFSKEVSGSKKRNERLAQKSEVLASDDKVLIVSSSTDSEPCYSKTCV